MALQNRTPYVCIKRSPNPTTTSQIDLTNDVTCIGRPEPDEVACIYLDYDFNSVGTISRRHARIIRETNGTFRLENWKGTHGIGLYEKRLMPGDGHILRHGDKFRIPDLLDAYYEITFGIPNETTCLPLLIEPDRCRVVVFNVEISIRGQQYELLNYLYQHRGTLCSYEQIIAHIWPDYTKLKRNGSRT